MLLCGCWLDGLGSWRHAVALPSLRAPLTLLHALLLPHMLVPPRIISQGGMGLPRGPCHLSGHWVARPPVSSDVCSKAPRHTLLGKQSRGEGMVV